MAKDVPTLIADVQALIADIEAKQLLLAFWKLGNVITDVEGLLSGANSRQQLYAALSARELSMSEAVGRLKGELGATTINWANVLSILLAIGKILIPLIFGGNTPTLPAS